MSVEYSAIPADLQRVESDRCSTRAELRQQFEAMRYTPPVAKRYLVNDIRRVEDWRGVTIKILASSPGGSL